MAVAGPIRALCDDFDQMIEADEALAGLQRRCGGDLPGTLAVPALLALVRKVRTAGQPLACMVAVQDEGQPVSLWAAVYPQGSGTRIEIGQWRAAADARRDDDAGPGQALVRQLAEAHVLLDTDQRLIAATVDSADLADFGARLAEGRGQAWTDFVELEDVGHRQPLHWRLLDDVALRVPGSERGWHARIFPLQVGGFELFLVADTVLELPCAADEAAPAPADSRWNGLLGHEMAPALRQPVSRIIANAETIRTRLAGPIADEYADYAADIAEAGRHLLSLVEDLADLEAVEEPGFAPDPDHIDLADCARRSAGILSVRAQERGIVIATPGEDIIVPALGEFRRVLQILLNLLGNAIRYTPGHSAIMVDCGTDADLAWISVTDQGQGLTADQAEKVFNKFERLGRSGDGGSGLGLYISRRLARAMGGELSVRSEPDKGACFILSLPADRPDTASARA